MNQSDELPKCICTDCWQKVDEFHNFHRSVLDAQKEYLKRSIKSEIERDPDSNLNEITNPPSFVEVITNCDEFNVYPDGTIKDTNELDDDNHQQEMEPHGLDDLCNDTGSAIEESKDAHSNDDGNPDYDDEDYTDGEGDGDGDDDDDDENVEAAGKGPIYLFLEFHSLHSNNFLDFSFMFPI